MRHKVEFYIQMGWEIIHLWKAMKNWVIIYEYSFDNPTSGGHKQAIPLALVDVKGNCKCFREY